MTRRIGQHEGHHRIGIACALASFCSPRPHGGTNPVAFINIPALVLIVRRHDRRHDGVDQLSLVHDRAQGGHAGVQGIVDRLCRTRSARWSSCPRRPAATACWRSRRTSPRSTTSTHARACSWSSTAPTPISCARSWSPRSTAWPTATPRWRPVLQPPAASPRPSGSSAPSWAWSTCSRTWTRPVPLGPAISGAFIATLYGVGSANLIFLPISNKLKEMSATELNHRTMLHRAHPLDPGRRQPAPAGREARDVHRAGRARPGGSRRGGRRHRPARAN